MRASLTELSGQVTYRRAPPRKETNGKIQTVFDVLIGFE
jgi:hypothetical protein